MLKKSQSENITNNYIYLFKSIFVGVNRLFVFIYLNRNDDVKITKSKEVRRQFTRKQELK